MALVDALVLEGEKCPATSEVAASLTSDFLRVDKKEAIEQHLTRFSKE